VISNSHLNIIPVITAQRIRWIYGTYREEKCIQRFGGESERKQTTSEIILKIHLLGSVSWINVAQERQIADPYEHGDRGFYATRENFDFPSLSNRFRLYGVSYLIKHSSVLRP